MTPTSAVQVCLSIMHNIYIIIINCITRYIRFYKEDTTYQLKQIRFQDSERSIKIVDTQTANCK